MGGLEEVSKTGKINMFKKCVIEFQKIKTSSQHRSMKLPAGLNHLEVREVEMWGLWLQREWELMLGKAGGGGKCECIAWLRGTCEQWRGLEGKQL